MMVIDHLGADSVGIKVSGSFVTLKHDGTIKIGDHTLEGAGEYDINRIGAHVYEGAATIFADGNRLDVVWDAKSKPGNEEEVANDALLVLHSDISGFQSLSKEIESPIIILHSLELAEAVAKDDAINLEKTSTYKLAGDLTSEERSFILLA